MSYLENRKERYMCDVNIGSSVYACMYSHHHI